jgi:acyl-CoA thioesterase FadM
MGMVVVSVKCDYLESICFGQSVRVGLTLDSIGAKSLRFRFKWKTARGNGLSRAGMW